ncbi:MAG: histidine kinase, partial [Thermoleophilia bacterium]|nr:histidine kinase [Thermoleophilia bacterium]
MSGPGSPAGALDLAECAREPIQVPGAVQPHGCLVAAAGPRAPVAWASANTAGFLGRDAGAVLGARLADVVGPALAGALGERLPGAGAPWRGALGEPPAPVEVVVHRGGPGLVVEVEAAPEGGPADPFPALARAVGDLDAAERLPDVLAAAARGMRGLTGFDRVMVYRFDREWNGEVVGEERAEG